MAIGGVVLQFKADADKAVRDVNKLTRSLDKMGSEAKDSGRKFSTMAKVGIGAAVAGIGVGVTALVQFGKAAADDYREAQALVDVLKKVPGITQAMIDANADWIGSMELAWNIADKDIRESVAKLAVATRDLGEAQKLAALAADVAAARNMSLADATSLLEKAVGGNTMMLKRNMPWLDANSDGTITLEEAVRGLGKAYGGAAEAAANRDPWKKLEIIWGNIQEALGQAFLPTLGLIGDWFKDKKNIAKIQEWIDRIGEWSQSVGVEFRDKIVEFVEYLQSAEGQAAMRDFADGVRDVAQAFADIGTAISAVVGWFGKLSAAWDKLPSWLRTLLSKASDWVNPLKPYRELADSFGTARDRYNSWRNGTPYYSPTTASQNRALAESRGGSTVNVYVENGKQEKSVDSAAMAIRLAKATGAVL